MKTSRFTDEQIAMALRQVGSWADGDNRVTADRDGAVVDHSTSGVHRHYRPALDQKIYGFAGRSQPTAKPRERGGSHQASAQQHGARKTQDPHGCHTVRDSIAPRAGDERERLVAPVEPTV